ncbi:MAG: TraB/GumN family protein [Bacteroidia bacterium]|nr:TraB/GumN family protein [Bacteroidia bacterium]NNJ54577.1 TraB/GumN family protein [Bacteroidia bacterium]
MKKIITLLFFSPLFTFAQNSILFEVSKPGQTEKSYLMGTIHVQDEKAFNFNDSVFWAIDQCSKTAFELDLSLGSIKKMDEKAITEIIDTQYITSLGKYIETNFIPQLVNEIPAKDLAHKITANILPAYIEFMKLKFSANNRTQFVDQYLQNYARKNKKEIIGIETYTEQFKAILGNMSSFDYEKANLSDKMIEFIKKDNIDFDIMELFNGTEQMIDFYHQGDLRGLCDYLNTTISSTNAFATSLYERIFFDRNDLMFERTKDRMAEGGMFVAVGSGHLCGDNGLISQYQNAGFNVRAVDVSSESNREIEWRSLDKQYYTVDLPKGTHLTENKDVMGMGFLLESMMDTTYANTLFTSKGMATFKIERTDYNEDAEAVNDEFDYAAFLKELQEIKDSTPGYEDLDYMEEADDITEIESIENIDYPTEINGERIYEMDEVDEAAVYEEVAVEAVYDEDDEEISDYEGDYEMEEAEYAEGYYDSEIEEYDDIDYETEIEDEGFPYSKNSIKNKLTEEQQVYFKEVGDSISRYIKQEMGTLMMSMMGMMGGNSESYPALVNDEEVELDFSRSMLGSSISTIIETETSEYELTIEGDPEVLQSEDLRRFFTSFKLKE